MTTARAYETTKLDIDERQDKAADLLKYNVSVLEGAPLTQLRSLAKGLIKNINSKQNDKLTLLAKLLVIRDEAQKVIDEKTLDHYKSVEVKKERRTDKELTSTTVKANEMIATIKSKVTGVTNELERIEIVVMYATATLEGLRAEYQPTTIKGMLTEIGGVLNTYETDSDLLRMSLDTFKKTLWSQFSKDVEIIKYNDKIRVAKNLTTDKLVRGNTTLEKAKKVLESIPMGAIYNPKLRDNPVNWCMVAISLVLVTGRRPAEIMASAIFKPGDNANALQFKGQLKAKGENRESRMEEFRTIPCLVDNYLAINALNYITPKRLEDPDEVNNAYAKEMSRQMKHWFEAVGRPLNVYAFRKVYASLCKRFYYTGSEKGAVIYIAELMGHQTSDYTTVQTYREFELADED